MKKVLVIGIKGMAGHMLFARLPTIGNYDVHGIARNVSPQPKIYNVDVSDTVAIENIIRENNFDYIINCIGILNKDAEDYPDKAIWFNSFFPHFLERLTVGTATKVIHISTDCVFNGKRGGYTENDVKDGIGFYAQSKALGELDNPKDLTIRTSIIGPEINNKGIGLFHWFMSQPANAELKGFSAAYWSGLTTLELSNAIHEAITQNISGLIEVAPREKIDKYSLLQLFNEIFRGGEMKIISDSSYSVDKSLTSIRTDFTYSAPDYRQMLNDLRRWIDANPIYNY